MTGRLVDLGVPGVRLPERIVVDTNLIVEYLVAPFLLAAPASLGARNAMRARWFFDDLFSRSGLGIVTPTAFAELVHVAVKTHYNERRLQLGSSASAVYGRPIGSWLDLYKLDPAILQSFRPDLEQIQQMLKAIGLLFLAPEDLGPIASGRRHDDELVHVVGT